MDNRLLVHRLTTVQLDDGTVIATEQRLARTLRRQRRGELWRLAGRIGWITYTVLVTAGLLWRFV